MIPDHLTFVCWKYKPHGMPPGHRKYTAVHVNRFTRMVKKHYPHPHKVVCITDEPGFIEEAQTIDMPVVLPNNFRKLWLFSKEAAELIPGRVFFCDIDCVMAGDLTGLVDRDEDFVAWHDFQYSSIRYSSGTYMLDMGSRPFVWDEFSMDKVPEIEAWMKEYAGHMVGSDMAWMSYILGEEATFDPGIYRARKVGKKLPKDARIVHFSGKMKPWSPQAKDVHPWLSKLSV